jgi:DNA invertase Pin-like site-specific DNA recombinase
MEPFFDSCDIMRDVVIIIMAKLAEQDRTMAGLASARKEGKIPGPKPATLDMEDILRHRKANESLRTIASVHGMSPSLLVKRLKAASSDKLLFELRVTCPLPTKICSRDSGLSFPKWGGRT